MKTPAWMHSGSLFPPSAEKYVVTVCLCFLNIGWGTIVVMPGPTLMDLQRMIGGDPSMMNWVFFARTLGYLISAPLGGLTARFSLQMSIIFSSVVIAVTTLAIPWCPLVWQMTTVFGIHGLSLGVFDIVTTVLLIKMWAKHKAAYIQLFNVIGYTGSLIAPTLARPFISEQKLMTMNTNYTTPHDTSALSQKGNHYGFPMWKADYANGRGALETEDTSNLKGLFALLASYELVIGFVFYLIIIYFKDLDKYDRYVSEPDSNEETTPEKHKNQNGRRIHRGICFLVIIISLSCSMQFLSGGEVALAVGSYGSEYIVQYHKGTLDDALLAETIFAASMVIFGIISIMLLKFIRTDIMIKLNVFFQGVGALFFLGGSINFVVLCMGMVIVAASLSSFTSSNICWATDRVGRPALVASVVALGYPLGEMLFPLIIGLSFTKDPNSLIYCMYGNAMVLLFIYTVGEIISTSAKMGEFSEMTVELDNIWDKLRKRIVQSDCCNDNASTCSEDRALLHVLETPEDQMQPSISGYLVQPRADGKSRTPFDAELNGAA
ncbi:major facilitator superfamily domain-containing protein 4A-like [Lineus longissimus]|uniref:major facilitator superfamily domain-containing protein 4A-like n=1 Tax=Lineus longissimus TaxID=88925 RepID=UPI00315D29A4